MHASLGAGQPHTFAGHLPLFVIPVSSSLATFLLATKKGEDVCNCRRTERHGRMLCLLSGAPKVSRPRDAFAAVLRPGPASLSLTRDRHDARSWRPPGAPGPGGRKRRLSNTAASPALAALPSRGLPGPFRGAVRHRGLHRGALVCAEPGERNGGPSGSERAGGSRAATSGSEPLWMPRVRRNRLGSWLVFEEHNNALWCWSAAHPRLAAAASCGGPRRAPRNRPPSLSCLPGTHVQVPLVYQPRDQLYCVRATYV